MKRQLKITLLIALLSVLLLGGCAAPQKEANPTPEKSLVGSWTISPESAKNLKKVIGDVSLRIVLNADGTGSVDATINGDSKTYSGTYTKTDKTITISSADLDAPLTIGYAFKGDDIIATYSAVQVTLVRGN
ncbi:hypothetical protein [Eubacterium barkeri]|uniref:Lipocalin-like domain-containing protein n=1 Tax=Eubacterium barkeri TaxID=1528 RepID=A0A1H3I237_EUBBA|nr:hypothetical protein [Eubacterium barkeri]SDY21179.1 hypothetical protein SAMN04488579_12032 [Eubacterium barkeri]